MSLIARMVREISGEIVRKPATEIDEFDKMSRLTPSDSGRMITWGILLEKDFGILLGVNIVPTLWKLPIREVAKYVGYMLHDKRPSLKG